MVLSHDCFSKNRGPISVGHRQACGLTNNALSALAPLITLRPHLRTLNLSDNHISYTGGFTLLCSLAARFAGREA